jgi:hypothetical protein
MSTQFVQPSIPVPFPVMGSRECLECGQEIHQERLDAMPDAEYCIACQPAYDRKPNPEDFADPDTIRELTDVVMGEWGVERLRL